MKTLKQVLAIAAIILSVAGLVISLAGIAGVWMINDALTSEVATDVFDRTETALTALENTLDRVIVALERSRSAIETIDQAAGKAGDKIESSSPVANLISNTIGDELFPAIIGIRDTISGVRSTIIAVNASIEAANAIPLVSIPTLPMEKLQAVDERASNAVDRVQELRADVAALKSGAADALVSNVTTRTGAIDDDLAAIETFAGAYRDDVGRVSAGLAAVRAKLPGMLDLASVLLTVVLLWFSVGQVSLVVSGWRFLKSAA
jgi:hypothetical protein